MKEEDILIPFSLTYVRYNSNSIISKILALFTLSPIFIMVMYSTIILIRRDLQTLLITIGQLLNVLFNLILKYIIKQPRPLESDLLDPGMPSNHCQFIGFFCTIYILQFIRAKDLLLIFRILYSIYVIILGFLVCYSRYYLNYHHEDQIFVGVIVGIIFAFVWDWFCQKISPITRSVGKLWICKWLQIRDYSDVNYAPMFEYNAINEMLEKKQTNKKSK